MRRERIRKSRAPAGFASKPLQECNRKNLETLLLEFLKTMKSCPSHCKTAATRQNPRKLRRERIRKSRAPAGFASKPLQEYSLKNLETLLLAPLKTMKNNENVLLLEPPKTMKSFPSHCETAATRQSPRKLRRERSPSRFCVQAIAGVQPQKSRNVAFGTLKNNENVLLLEPLKTMKSCPSHCETAATRQSPRKLRRERIRKTLRLEPLKTMKSCPSHCETAATRQSPRKLRRERIRKSRAPAGFVPKPLRNRSQKNAETSLLEPTKKKEV